MAAGMCDHKEQSPQFWPDSINFTCHLKNEQKSHLLLIKKITFFFFFVKTEKCADK